MAHNEYIVRSYYKEILMYQVISVRVLRQAMSWMGIPSPWFRTTQFFRWPDGRLTSTIKCMWNFDEIRQWHDDKEEVMRWADTGVGKREMELHLRSSLVDCFCDDIRVVICRYEAGPHWFVAYLTCTVIPKDAICMGEMPSWSYDPARLDL